MPIELLNPDGLPKPDVYTQTEQEAGVDPVRPITLIGVTALGEPDLLVEIEAIAVLP